MEQEQYDILIKKMVEQQLIARDISDKRVLEAILSTPRHLFVPDNFKSQSYGDYPLPIGEGQTISQPYIVALMTEALSLQGNEKVLEIGTGSGYQTAILSKLCNHVYSIERLESLFLKAKKIIEELGIKNVTIKVGDGTLGWEEESPFDRIIVTAGAPNLPENLWHQLKEGGKIVIPIGNSDTQFLYLFEKDKGGGIKSKSNLCACRFVKLIGKNGWQEGEYY